MAASSSSSGDIGGPPGVASGKGKGSSAADPDKLTLQLQPHAGFIAVDQLPDETVITHLVTYERLALQPGGWQVVFDEDGYGVAAPPDNCELDPVLLEDSFVFVLRKAVEDGSFVIVGRAESAGAQFIHLPSHMQKWELKEVFVQVGPASNEVKFEGALFRWLKNPGARFIWSCKAVYEGLGFNQFNGQQWRWVDASWRRWKKQAENFGLGEHVVPTGLMKEGRDCAESGFLPWVGVSSHILLHLLATWATAPPRFGGMQKAPHRLAASQLLLALLGVVKPRNESGDVCFSIELVSSWSPSWPRPSTEKRIVHFRVDAEGNTNIQDIARHLPPQPGAKDSEWCSRRKLSAFASKVATTSLYDVFLEASQDKQQTQLYKQLVWNFGQILDNICRETKFDPKGFRVKGVTFDDALKCAPALDRKLAQYIEAARQTASAHNLRALSVATDKASVAGLGGGVQNSVIVLGNRNLAIFGPPQVVRAYEGELTTAADAGQDTAPAKKQVQGRHQSWIQRHLSGEQVTWKGAKRYRLSAKSWLFALDNAIGKALPMHGLGNFLATRENMEEWGDWRGWRHLMVSIDQGSDGLSAASFLKSRDFCGTFIMDWSRGAQNDFYDTLRDLHLWGFWVLMLVVCNVEHGPWADDYCWNQVQSAWKEVVAHFQPEELPLFAEYMARMLQEAGGRAALMSRGGDSADVATLLWDMLRDGWAPKGHKTNLNRFFATREKAETLLPVWTATRLKYEYLTLETGAVAAKKIAKLKIQQPRVEGGEDGEARETTCSAKPSIAEKALRGSAQNAMVLATIMLGEQKHLDLFRAIVSATRAVHKWHQMQNHTNRCAKDSQVWMIQQLNGGFMASVDNTLELMKKAVELEFVGIDLKAYGGSKLGAPGGSTDQIADQEGEMANVYGQLCITLAARRITRCMFLLRGWPLRFVGLLGSQALRDETIAAFRRDLKAHEAMKVFEAKDGSHATLERRSCFGDCAVRQFQEAFEELGCQASGEIQQLAKENFSGINNTQCVEDCFNHQKNAKLVKGKKRHRRVEKTMGVVLARSVLDKIHRYKTIATDVPTAKKAIKLPKSAFYADYKRGSGPWKDIVSTRQAAPFYSPQARHWTTRDFDLELVSSLHERGALQECRYAWLGELCLADHQVLIKKGDGPWRFAMGHMPASCVLAIPARTALLPNSNIRYWVPHLPQVKPTLLTITSLDGWKAVRYSWRSPAWQARVSPSTPKTLPPALRAFLHDETCGEDTLLRVAAREAFFSLDRAFLTDLAAFTEVVLQPGMSLFDLLLKLVMATLGIGEEPALVHLRKRMGAFAARENFSEELAELDEAAELLEKSDRTRLSEEKESIERVKVQEAAFKECFTKKASEVRNKNTRNKKGQRRVQVPHFPEHSITIEQARTCIPKVPKCALWMSKQFGNWQGSYPDFPRISRSWQRYGEKQALLLVLEYLWNTHMQATGLTREECNVHGLWDQIESLGNGAGQQSASSSG